MLPDTTKVKALSPLTFKATLQYQCFNMLISEYASDIYLGCIYLDSLVLNKNKASNGVKILVLYSVKKVIQVEGRTFKNVKHAIP